MPRIPSAWSWITINDACLKVQDGTHFSPQNQLAQGAYRYITAKNVRPSGLDLRNISYLAEDEHRAIYKRCDPKKGDVLLVKDGVNTGDAAVNTLDEEFSLLSSVCLLRPRPELLFSQFLRYYLLSPVGYRMLTGQMTGTAIKRIILGRIKESPVPIAPLDEQRTIVAEIEKQFSRLDEAVANLKRVKANLKRYKAAVLKSAVEGNLTEDWRKQHSDVESASKLLERILAKHRERLKGTLKRPSATDANNQPPLPEGWASAHVGSILQVRNGFAFRSAEYCDNGVALIRQANLGDRWVDLSNAKRLPESSLVDHQDFLVRKGDLLIGMSGSLGKIAEYAGDAPALQNQRTGLLCIDSEIARGFAKLVLQYVEPQIISEGKGIAVQNVSASEIESCTFMLPPLAEQERIVAEIEHRLSVIEELEAAVGANLTRADRFRQSILKAAFSGRLSNAA